MRAYIFMAVSFILMALMGICFAEDGGGDEFFVSTAIQDDYGSVGVDNLRALQRNFTGRIGSRLTALHEGAVGGGVARLGSSEALASPADGGCFVQEKVNRIWLGAFGAWTRQDDKGGHYGYKYDASGFVLGYDWEQAGDLTLGVSGAYSSGDVKNNPNTAQTKVETINLGMYASYDPVGGLFADAAINYGHSWNKASIDALGGRGYRKGDYSTHSFGGGVNVGYVFERDNGVRVTPTLGIQWTHVHQNGWDERTSRAGMLAQWYDGTDDDYLEVPLAVRVNKSYQLANGMILTPEARAALIFDVGPTRPTVRTGYVGGGETTTLYGMDPGKTRGLIGAGVKANLSNQIDAYLDYNHEFRSGYTNSNLTGGVGVSF